MRLRVSSRSQALRERGGGRAGGGAAEFEDLQAAGDDAAIAHYAVQPAKFAASAALAVRQLADTGILSAKTIRLMPSFEPAGSIASIQNTR